MTKHKVVLVPFPFDDLSGQKVRPAVCLTDPVGMHKHVVLAFITSQSPTDPVPTDLFIDSEDEDFAQTGLRVSSTFASDDDRHNRADFEGFGRTALDFADRS